MPTVPFIFPIFVEISEKDKPGTVGFHFVAASPLGLQIENVDAGFKIIRGLILMNRFEWKIVHRALENLINHSRHLETWDEIIIFWSRYGVYESEGL